MNQDTYTFSRLNNLNQPAPLFTTEDNACDRPPSTPGYHHLTTRDLAADLKKAQRKWNSKPRAQQTPVLREPMGKGGTVIGRTLAHYQAKLHSLTDPMHVLIITLFKPTKPQCHKFNAEIEGWARSGAHQHQIHIRYVDPADWGLT